MIKDILELHGERMVKGIRDNLASTGTNASGKTSDSVRFDVNGNTLTVVGGRAYFPTVETGSKPSTKNPSPEMIQSLTEWAQAKNVNKPVWGVAKKILKEGSELWRKGGRKDIYSNIDIEPLIKDLAKDQTAQIVNVLKRERWQ